MGLPILLHGNSGATGVSLLPPNEPVTVLDCARAEWFRTSRSSLSTQTQKTTESGSFPQMVMLPGASTPLQGFCLSVRY